VQLVQAEVMERQAQLESKGMSELQAQLALEILAQLVLREQQELRVLEFKAVLEQLEFLELMVQLEPQVSEQLVQLEQREFKVMSEQLVQLD
jgi:hypothetical protein